MYYQGDKTKDKKKKKKNYIIYLSIGISNFCSSIIAKRKRERERNCDKRKGKKMECCKERPNRSDVHLSVEEEAKLEAKAREYFDEAAPKRHTKPQRSEYSTQYVDSNNDDNNNNFIPELVEFQRLENDPQVGFSF